MLHGLTRLGGDPLAGSGGPRDGARWRVFISHTSELRNFPKPTSYIGAVERAISAAGHVIVDMADFAAAGQAPAQLCAERVRGCDVYVGVLGTRYGSPVRDRPEVSYTELEFDTATEAGLDRLMFLLDTDADDAGIPPSALIDREFGARQDAFRRRVQDSQLIIRSFASPAELGQLVERSLHDLAQARWGIGSGIQSEQVPLTPPGRPISEWNPFSLGIHYPITATRLSVSYPADTTPLPKYVVRDHDLVLGGLLDPGRPGPRMVVLTGGSCTGKTRAAYEAVTRYLPTWRLVRPETAIDLVQLLSDRTLDPQTVVWLNETQIYLERQQGEEASAALRRLLAENSQVIVIGSMWTRYWQELTARSEPDQPDNAQARELLQQSVMRVPVPSGFSSEALQSLKGEGLMSTAVGI